jgi:hypothetical protein
MIPPLLDLLEVAVKDKKEQPLYNKIREVLNGMLKQRKVSKYPI